MVGFIPPSQPVSPPITPGTVVVVEYIRELYLALSFTLQDRDMFLLLAKRSGSLPDAKAVSAAACGLIYNAPEEYTVRPGREFNPIFGPLMTSIHAAAMVIDAQGEPWVRAETDDFCVWVHPATGLGLGHSPSASQRGIEEWSLWRRGADGVESIVAAVRAPSSLPGTTHRRRHTD